MSASAKKTYMRAGELARASGVSTDTLRHYERKGVLPKPRRSPNGYREYASESLARVLLVRRALAFGFTLDELARVLRASQLVECRSEEHTSELQSRSDLVCRLLLEKKKNCSSTTNSIASNATPKSTSVPSSRQTSTYWKSAQQASFLGRAENVYCKDDPCCASRAHT